jgi:ABC-type transport system involved in multi-copper enzyme maturation permease subunit
VRDEAEHNAESRAVELGARRYRDAGGVSAVFSLSVRQLLGKWRLLVLLGLATLPLIPAAIAAASSDPWQPSNADDVLIDGLLASGILPLIALTVATAAFGNEVDDKTLGNLTLAPLGRGRIVAAKLIAAFLVAVPFVVGSTIVSVWLGFAGADIGGAGRATTATAIAMTVGVAVYSAMFVWAGLVTSHPLGFGLIYVFVWEGLFASFVDGIKYLSVRQFTLGIVTALDETRFSGVGQDVIGPAAAIVGSAVVFCGFTLLAVRRLKRMDVV